MEDEIKSCLSAVLKENMEDYSVNILGNSEKGDGYLSDILFVTLTPTNQEGKVYELVLKSKKRGKTLETTTCMNEAFKTEIHFYDKMLPAFTEFQLQKGLDDFFNTVPKCYGTFTTENVQIIVLENLKMNGYTLWDKKKPLTRKHIDLIVEEYAKFHSVSIAMREQNPQKFQELSDGLGTAFKMLVRLNNLDEVFGSTVVDIYNLLKGDLDENTLDTWKTLQEQARFILDGMFDKDDGLKVILHASCWTNNFMFKYDCVEAPSKVIVSILDWQLSRVSSPILDISYFIFANISKEDVENTDDILNDYYRKLKLYSSRLGINLDSLYSKKHFLDNWKKYAKFGALYASLVHKICSTEKDEVIDVINNDEGIVAAFSYDVKNKTAFKNRTRHIVKYVVESRLI